MTQLPPLQLAESPLVDRLDRPLRDLRISVTDRCNFRCPYCMPRDKTDGRSFLPRKSIIDFEEITRLARLFVSLGVKKIRLTGGEPLLRRQLPKLVSQLKPLGVELALTTNGVLLNKYAEELSRAGLDRLTVSLDALDETIFQECCDAGGYGVKDVLAGIESAERAGFSSMNINCVIRRGVNDAQIRPIVQHFSRTSHTVRFIEYMDVGTRNAWNYEHVMTQSQIISELSQMGELHPAKKKHVGEVVNRFSFAEGGGEVGVISSVSRPFCGDCCRARLSADGNLYSCLFATGGLSLLSHLRADATDSELTAVIAEWWSQRTDRYSEQRSQGHASQQDTKLGAGVRTLPLLNDRVEMSYIGG